MLKTCTRIKAAHEPARYFAVTPHGQPVSAGVSDSIRGATKGIQGSANPNRQGAIVAGGDSKGMVR